MRTSSSLTFRLEVEVDLLEPPRSTPQTREDRPVARRSVSTFGRGRGRSDSTHALGEGLRSVSILGGGGGRRGCWRGEGEGNSVSIQGKGLSALRGRRGLCQHNGGGALSARKAITRDILLEKLTEVGSVVGKAGNESAERTRS